MGQSGDTKAVDLNLLRLPLGQRVSRTLTSLVIPFIATELGLDPCQQLQGIKRLGDIVVRPHGQAHDLVHILHLGGEHDNGIQVGFPYPLAEGEAVHIREHHVQDGQVGMGVLRLGIAEGIGGVIKFSHGVAVVFQVDLYQVRDGGLVIDNQYFFVGHSLSSLGRVLRESPYVPCFSSLLLSGFPVNTPPFKKFLKRG